MVGTKIKLKDQLGRVVRVRGDGTNGATVGKDLRWPDGSLVQESQVRNSGGQTGGSTGGSVGGSTGGIASTIWRLVREVPANLQKLAALAGAGLTVRGSDGAWHQRSIAAGEGIQVENADGVAGNPTVSLAELEDGGGGELLKLVRDQYGRVAGTSAATTDDLDEGSTNLYFTTARAQAVIDAWISTLRFLTNAPDDDAALAAGVLTGQLYRNGSALMILVKEPPTYLDLLPVTPLCVWAIKKLVSTATVAIRVRRSSDNTEQDIGFSGDSLDVSALLAFVGAGSGYVTTIYDQTGGGKHFTQATTVSQPRIVNAGVYDGEMVFDGSDDIMSTATLTLGTQYAATYGRFRLPNGSDSIFLEYSANFFTTPYTFALYKNSSNSRMTIMQLAGEDTTNQFALTTGSKQVFSMLWDRQASPWSARMRAWENGVEKPATMIFDKSPSATFGDQPLFVGARSGGAYAGACGVESIALYRDDTLAIRGLIEASVGA